MEIFIGKILSKISVIMPNWSMSVRVKICDSIISKHSADSYQQYQTVQRFNRFLKTMKDSDRIYVMAMCGIKPAPAWRSLVHMGE